LLVDFHRSSYKSQHSFNILASMMCPICSLPLLTTHPRTVVLLFLCRHVVHAGCVRGGESIPAPPDRQVTRFGVDSGIDSRVALYVFSLLGFLSQYKLRTSTVKLSCEVGYEAGVRYAISEKKAYGHDTFILFTTNLTHFTHRTTACMTYYSYVFLQKACIQINTISIHCLIYMMHRFQERSK